MRKVEEYGSTGTTRWKCKRCGCTDLKGCRIQPLACYWVAAKLCSACLTPDEAHDFAVKGRTIGWDGLEGGVARLRADQGWQPRRGDWRELDLGRILDLVAGSRGRQLIEAVKLQDRESRPWRRPADD